MGAFNKIGYFLSAALGSGIFSQIPGFISHYIQRLGGRMDEAQDHVERWFSTNALTTKTLDDLLLQCSYYSPTLLQHDCVRDTDRFVFLRDTYDALTSAYAWERPFVFLRHLDYSIFKRTLHAYIPNIPTDQEGLAYVGVGAAFGILLYATTRSFFKSKQRKSKP